MFGVCWCNQGISIYNKNPTGDTHLHLSILLTNSNCIHYKLRKLDSSKNLYVKNNKLYIGLIPPDKIMCYNVVMFTRKKTCANAILWQNILTTVIE